MAKRKQYEYLEDDPEYRKILLDIIGGKWELVKKLVWVFCILFSLGVLSCIVLYFLQGFNKIQLSDKLLLGYAAVTIAEVAGISTMIIKYICEQ